MGHRGVQHAVADQIVHKMDSITIRKMSGVSKWSAKRGRKVGNSIQENCRTLAFGIGSEIDDRGGEYKRGDNFIGMGVAIAV